MFYYPGRKARAAPSYPKPEFDLVIEPFAGSMAYSLYWQPRMAIGIEMDDRLVGIWRRLCAMTPEEIRAYPIPEVGERFTDKWLMLADQSSGALGSSYRIMSPYMHGRAVTLKNQALRSHDYAVGNILYYHGDYQDAPNVQATWFIDPPYQDVNAYRHSDIDYAELAMFCRTRRGQVIVCEGAAATWMTDEFRDHVLWQGQPMLGKPNTTITEKVAVLRSKRIVYRQPPS